MIWSKKPSHATVPLNSARFLQSEVARSEAYNIANSAHQYLGPKDGMPLQGLIQVGHIRYLCLQFLVFKSSTIK